MVIEKEAYLSKLKWNLYCAFRHYVLKLQRQLEILINKTYLVKSLCLLAHDVILPPTAGLKLNEQSAGLYFTIVNSHPIYAQYW